MYDVAIVGGGPAGLSAALSLAHFRRSVLVLDAGEIVQRGRHEELLRQGGGLYSRLYQDQVLRDQMSTRTA